MNPEFIQDIVKYVAPTIATVLITGAYLLVRTRNDRISVGNLLRENEARWKLAIEESTDGVWEIDFATEAVKYSSNWKSKLGYKEDDLKNDIAAWKANIHPSDLPLLEDTLRASKKELTGPYTNEYRMLCKDGSYRWYRVRVVLVGLSENGQPIRAVGTHTDITDQKVAQDSMQLANLVYQRSSEGMMVADRDFKILSVNPAFSQITGYETNEILGEHPKKYRSEAHPEAFYSDMWRNIASNGSWSGEIWCKRKSGADYLQQTTINTINDANGNVERYVALFSDITKRKEDEEIIWKQANFDPLTGLPNRHMLQQILADHIKKADQKNQQIAVMILDLDGFKEVNDTLGHDRGDLLLQEAATRLRSCVRNVDTIARLGGDEFIILLPDFVDLEWVEHVAALILEKMSRPFTLLEDNAYISASIGITFHPKDATGGEVLLKNADQAMYAAKSAGRNRRYYFEQSLQDAAHNRMHLANDLRTADIPTEFKIVYQPIIDLSTGSIHKAEALIRWHHPNRGMVSPAEFIPVAEETGSILKIGNWVFHEAAKQVAEWRKKHKPDFQISVNVSPAQFKSEEITDGAWRKHLEELGISGESIVVEITEGLLLDANEAVNDKLLGFRDAGIQVSLDDFGTGYSSLSYLKKFDIDYIKIDQSFVRNMSTGSNDLALCEAIIVMAHKLGMKVVAEGVETIEQRDLLAAAGCDYAQGYLFSRPIPGSDLEPLLKSGYIMK